MTFFRSMMFRAPHFISLEKTSAQRILNCVNDIRVNSNIKKFNFQSNYNFSKFLLPQIP